MAKKLVTWAKTKKIAKTAATLTGAVTLGVLGYKGIEHLKAKIMPKKHA